MYTLLAFQKKKTVIYNTLNGHHSEAIQQIERKHARMRVKEREGEENHSRIAFFAVKFYESNRRFHTLRLPQQINLFIYQFG